MGGGARGSPALSVASRDLFFHASAMVDEGSFSELSCDAEVTYSVSVDTYPQAPAACNVKLVPPERHTRAVPRAIMGFPSTAPHGSSARQPPDTG